MPRTPVRRVSLKACKNCGALVPKEATVCPVCGSTTFVDDWEGVMILLDNSALAEKLKTSKHGVFAIRVSGSYVFK